MKKIVARYNRACFGNDFDDIASNRDGNPQLRLDQCIIDQIFAANFTSALETLRSVWNLPTS